MLNPSECGAAMLKAREAVGNLKSYHPPLGNRQGLRLDFNENTVGCSPKVLERLRQLDYEDLARYPEREPLEKVVATHLGVDASELLLTNGTDEAIHLVCETFLEPGDEVIIVVPTFAMFEIYAASTGATVVSLPAGADFRFPLEEVLKRIQSRTRLIAVANPNNPTGAFVSKEDLLRLANAAPEAALLMDEAYYEFCGETMLQHVQEQKNLFVSRTFSKAYGLAGLRIGVLTANQAQMPMLRRNSSPYNLNAVALACLPPALADQEYVRSYVAQTLEGRAELEAELKARGIRYWPSRANFVLFYLGEAHTAFIAGMRTRGILVRDRSKDPGCAGCVRITLGSREHNQIMMAALGEVLAEIGVSEKVAR
jgi:histidinol-phosphate aminotransferase